MRQRLAGQRPAPTSLPPSEKLVGGCCRFHGCPSVVRVSVPIGQQKEHRMAEYLILIYEDEKGYADGTPELFGEVMAAHNRFAEQVVEQRGQIVSGRALQPSATATSICSDVVTDGPFVESNQ